MSLALLIFELILAGGFLAAGFYYFLGGDDVF